jgi:hypothetical protein
VRIWAPSTQREVGAFCVLEEGSYEAVLGGGGGDGY